MATPPQPPHRSFRAAHIKWLLLIALLVGVGVHIELARRAEAQSLAAEQAAHQQVLNAELEKSVEGVISQNQEISFSVAVLAGPGATPQVFGDSGTQDAASTAKLITAIAFMHRVEKGQASLNYQINDESAAAELKLLINQSDDVAWAAFNEKLGHYYLQAYANSLGLHSYSADDNTISAADLAKLVDLLSSSKLLNATHTKLLLSYMQHTNYEDFITPAVPLADKLYHKVGIDDDQVNDVAIIIGGQRTLAISIFTNGHGTYDWQNRAVLMQQITKAAEKAYL